MSKITRNNYNKDIYYTSANAFCPFKIVDWVDSHINKEGTIKIIWYRSEEMKPRSFSSKYLKIATNIDLTNYDTHQLNDHVTGDDGEYITLYKDSIAIGNNLDGCIVDNEVFEKMIKIYKKGYQS